MQKKKKTLDEQTIKNTNPGYENVRVICLVEA